MTDLVVAIHELIKLAESGKPSLRRSGLWKNKTLQAMKAGKRAELALRYQDEQDTGADDGPWEDEECDQGTQFGQGMNVTRIKRLQTRLAATCESSTEKTKTASVTVLKP